MKQKRLLCWNVNGLRALQKKGFTTWLQEQAPDVLCLQEVKAHRDQLGEELVYPEGYVTYWNQSCTKGYSGVATFAREEPLSVSYDFGGKDLPIEGRVLIAEFSQYTLMNIYFPNGKKNEERLQYKMRFYDEFLHYADSLKERGKRLVICGDVNTAHKEIDLARPKANEKVSGFLPMERAWIDKFVSHGYVDTLRLFHPEPRQYSWWDLKTGARERNVGWRIDYFFVSENLAAAVKDAFIMPEVTGSDHCPVGIILETG